MTSRIIVNNIQSDTGISSVTFNSNISVNGSVSSTGVSTFTSLTATSIVGVSTLGVTTAYIGSVNDGPIAGSRNRIINGDMRISQRGTGSFNNSSAANTYTVDRFLIYGNQDNKFSAQQNTVDAPIAQGFSHCLKITSSSSYAVASGETFTLQQRVEGLNTADFAFGTSSAKTITLSFWIRSSLTGTFGGAIGNSAGNRSYPFSYSILSANTWEYKTIVIPGDITGTWSTDNTTGINLIWSLGAGATYSGTGGVWSSSNLVSTTGATSVVGTNAATWYITGVQLESGTVATPFERRSYGQELALCQRYLCGVDTRPQAAAYHFFGMGVEATSTSVMAGMSFPVDMRSRPTSIISSAANTFYVNNITNFTTITTDQVGIRGGYVLFSGGSGLTSNSGRWLSNNNNTAYLYFNAEL